MSEWFVIVPEQTVNVAANPSLEVDLTNWSAHAGSAIARVTTQQKFGTRSIETITTVAVNDGVAYDELGILTAAEDYVISLWFLTIDNTLPEMILAARNDVDGADKATTVFTPTVINEWQRVEVLFDTQPAQTNLHIELRKNGVAGITTFYVDALQVEEKLYSTTYVDGDQPGCEWLGAPHASASQRSAQSRAGGLIQDLQDDYYLDIGQFISTGMPPLDLAVDSYALLPGGELNSIKVMSRVFTLTGVIRGTDVANLHANKQALLNVLKPGAVPGDQPVRIRYTGAAVEKEIAAYYEGGLETSITAQMECWEQVAIRFLADDPFWYEIGESSEELDSEDTATLRYATGRLRSTGQWDDLGLTADPVAGGTSYAIAVGPDGRVYFGGDFTQWDNVAGVDYIAVYDPQTDSWAGVGGASDFTDVIYDLIFGIDGTLYAVGEFLNCAGVLNADYIAQWDGANWTAVGQPVQGASNIVDARALAFDSAGSLYIGGSFTDWANIANADGIVRLAGGVYSAVGAPAIGLDTVRAIAISKEDYIYVGGDFDNFAGIPAADRIAAYNSGAVAWEAVGDGLNDDVRALVIYNNEVYIGGNFTDAGGDTNADRICKWNGTAYSALGTGLNNNCYVVEIAPDGMLYASGLFTQAGDIDIAERIAKWNGSSWAHLDLNLPDAAFVYVLSIAFSAVDPVVEQNYNVWIGFSISGGGAFAGDVIVTNDGTEQAYPQIIISRSGGAFAILEEVRNETTGKELLFNYSLLDAETLTIDLTSTQKSIVSDFFGARPDAILPNSDFGSFVLQPGDNLVTCFVDTDGTVEAFLVWKNTYWSND